MWKKSQAKPVKKKIKIFFVCVFPGPAIVMVDSEIN
jgi:hypothetical protein